MRPEQVQAYAPVFTTFALLFLLYDGAFSISLRSLLKGAGKSVMITVFNFLVSVIVVSVIMVLFKFPLLHSLLVGFILGGVSSAFVIPLLKQMRVQGETYSILTLESAITDVFCIVSALTVLRIIATKSFNFQQMISQVASLFAVASATGILFGIIWIIIVLKFLKHNKSYMVTIAYLILVYAITEFLNGNGAIAALFFGLVLKNSKELVNISQTIVGAEKKEAEQKEEVAISVTTESEEFFYSQISFFLKTFFFVYIGLLFNPSTGRTLIIAGVLALAIMLSRRVTNLVTKDISTLHRKLITSIFARGLAAAAIAQIVAESNISKAAEIVGITNALIIFTIFLSSASVFMLWARTGKQLPG